MRGRDGMRHEGGPPRGNDMRHEGGPPRGFGGRHRRPFGRFGMRHRRGPSPGVKLAVLAIGGTGIAALLTYYFAPNAWRKFTSDIAYAARQGWNQAGDAADWVGEEAEDLYDDAGEQASAAYDAAANAVAGAASTKPAAAAKTN